MKKLLFFFLLPLSLISQNIGDFHQGGVVFYIDNSMDHYEEVDSLLK